MLAIEQAVVGKRIGDIGFACQSACGATMATGLFGNWLVTGWDVRLHEAPEVPNYGRRGNGPRLDGRHGAGH